MAVIDVPQNRGTARTPAGTTTTDATLMHRQQEQTDTAFTQGAGVKLQETIAAKYGWGTVFNASGAAGVSATGQSLLVYPWTGAAFNGQAVDTPVSVPAGAGMMWVFLTSTKVGVIY